MLEGHKSSTIEKIDMTNPVIFSDENFEVNDINNVIEYTKDDIRTYGNREPEGYTRIKLLGK